MRRRRTVVAAATAATLVAGCSGPTRQVAHPPARSPAASPAGSPAASPDGPAVATEGVRAGQEATLYLYRVPLGPAGGRGSIVMFHPDAENVVVHASTTAKARLAVCPTGVSFGAGPPARVGPCVPIAPDKDVPLQPDHAGGDHVGMEFVAAQGDADALPVEQITLTYHAVDGFLYVRFAAR